MNVPENENMVNLKSASFIVFMHLPEGLTHIQSQIKPWLDFGESFTSIQQVQQINTCRKQMHMFKTHHRTFEMSFLSLPGTNIED